MKTHDLWKYCKAEHCGAYLLSLGLLGKTNWPKRKQLACLYAVSNRIEEHYKLVMLKKKNGSWRQIYAPDPLLRKIQRNILHNVLSQAQVSSYATAYKKGAGILYNARQHVGQRYILKLDIKDFYNHITFPMIYARAFSQMKYPPPVRALLTSLCCRQDVLPQGAPTSAAISNLVMRPFDTYMGRWCAPHGIIYTRYCDDMTFSGDFDSRAVIKKVHAYLSAMGFSLNGEKTRLIPQSGRQTVTGIVVNQRLQVPRAYRRAVRQEVYYCEKYGVASHLSMKVQGEKSVPLAPGIIRKYLAALLGKINFILHISPDAVYFQQARHKVIRWMKNFPNSQALLPSQNL